MWAVKSMPANRRAEAAGSKQQGHAAAEWKLVRIYLMHVLYACALWQAKQKNVPFEFFEVKEQRIQITKPNQTKSSPKLFTHIKKTKSSNIDIPCKLNFAPKA